MAFASPGMPQRNTISVLPFLSSSRLAARSGLTWGGGVFSRSRPGGTPALADEFEAVSSSPPKLKRSGKGRGAFQDFQEELDIPLSSLFQDSAIEQPSSSMLQDSGYEVDHSNSMLEQKTHASDMEEFQAQDAGAFHDEMAEDISSLTIPKLKELLKAEGLPVNGNKPQLLRRLREALGAAAGPPSAIEEEAEYLDLLAQQALQFEEDEGLASKPKAKAKRKSAAKRRTLNAKEKAAEAELWANALDGNAARAKAARKQMRAKQGQETQAGGMLAENASTAASLDGVLSPYIDMGNGRRIPRLIMEAGGRIERRSETTGKNMPRRKIGAVVFDLASVGFRAFDTTDHGTGSQSTDANSVFPRMLDTTPLNPDRIEGTSRDSFFIQSKFNPILGDKHIRWKRGLVTDLGGASNLMRVLQNVSRKAIDVVPKLIKKLQVRMIDSLVLDAPPNQTKIMEAWRAMENAVQGGSVRNLGIAGVDLIALQKLYKDAVVKPAIVQEGFFSDVRSKVELLDWCRQHDICVQCHGVLAAARRPIVRGLLESLAAKYDSTLEEVFLRYVMSLGIVPLVDPNEFDQKEFTRALKPWRVPLSAEDATLIDDLMTSKRKRRR